MGNYPQGLPISFPFLVIPGPPLGEVGYGGDVLPKIINFLWLCYHNSVPMRDVLANRGISNNNVCLVCGRQGETIIHTLRECEFARFCWSKLQPPTW